jgi:hypothetical protein
MRPEKMMQRSSRTMLSTGGGVTLVATMTMPGHRYWITSSAMANSVSGMVRPDDELELGRLHHRQIGRLFALEDAPGISAGQTICIEQTRSVAHEAAGLNELTEGIYCGRRMVGRQRGELIAPRGKQGLSVYRDRADRCSTSLAKAVSISLGVPASRITKRTPRMRAAISASLFVAAAVGLVELSR